ncbi:MAG: lipoprotein LpqH [Propionibacteriaceae bacterium]|nr:lipoprotein LpqH [Propionibacteriaceae bacterium]
MNRIKLAGLAATSILALSLAACGQADAKVEDPKPVEATATETAAAETAAEPTEAAADETEAAANEGGAAAGGSAKITVDGQEITISDAVIVCQPANGNMNIAIGSQSAQEGLSIVLTEGDAPTVKAVGLVDADKNAVAYAEGSGMGSASATKDGNTYTVTGEGIVTDLNNPTSIATKPFEATVECN